jgi:hypothetical protein
MTSATDDRRPCLTIHTVISAGPLAGGDRNVPVMANVSGNEVAATAALPMAARRYPPFRKPPMLQEPSRSTDHAPSIGVTAVARS